MAENLDGCKAFLPSSNQPFYKSLDKDAYLTNDSDDEGSYDVSCADGTCSCNSSDSEYAMEKIISQDEYNQRFFHRNTKEYDEVVVDGDNSNSDASNTKFDEHLGKLAYDKSEVNYGKYNPVKLSLSDSNEEESSDEMCESSLRKVFNRRAMQLHNMQCDEVEDVNSEGETINSNDESCKENLPQKLFESSRYNAIEKHRDKGAVHRTNCFQKRADDNEEISMYNNFGRWYRKNDDKYDEVYDVEEGGGSCSDSDDDPTRGEFSLSKYKPSCSNTLNKDRIVVSKRFKEQGFVAPPQLFVANEERNFKDKVTVCNEDLQKEFIEHSYGGRGRSSKNGFNLFTQARPGQARRNSLTDNQEQLLVSEFVRGQTERRSSSQELEPLASDEPASKVQSNSGLTRGKRRKQRKNSENLQKAEDIPGHCGNKDIDELVNFIENKPAKLVSDNGSKSSRKKDSKRTSACKGKLKKGNSDLKTDSQQANKKIESRASINRKPQAKMAFADVQMMQNEIANTSDCSISKMVNAGIVNTKETLGEVAKDMNYDTTEEKISDDCSNFASAENGGSTTDNPASTAVGDLRDFESEDVSSVISSVAEDCAAFVSEEAKFIVVVPGKKKKKSFTNVTSLPMTSRTQHYMQYSSPWLDLPRSVTPPPDSFSSRAERLQLPSPSAFPLLTRIRRRSGSEGAIALTDDDASLYKTLDDQELQSFSKRSFAKVAAEKSSDNIVAVELQTTTAKTGDSQPSVSQPLARDASGTSGNSDGDADRCLAGTDCSQTTSDALLSSKFAGVCNSSSNNDATRRDMSSDSCMSNADEAILYCGNARLQSSSSIRLENLPTSDHNHTLVGRQSDCVSQSPSVSEAVVFLDGKIGSDIDINFGFDLACLTGQSNRVTDTGCSERSCVESPQRNLDLTISSGMVKPALQQVPNFSLADESSTYNYYQVVGYLRREWLKALQRSSSSGYS